jgi:hypothetical protein
MEHTANQALQHIDSGEGRGTTGALERLTVQDVLRQIELIQEVQRLAMKDGEHYGVIPGTQKPTLLKAGAEKLCLLFRFDPEYEIERCTQDESFISYTIRCSLLHIGTGSRHASGLGSCNSRENKYRWRQPKIKCPACEKEQIIKGKEEYGGGWLCWKKKGGCGAKFKDGDQAIEGQSTERVENDNPWELDNTLLKMACKRALVAAILNGTAASDIYTQDLEDIRIHIKPDAPKEPDPPATPAPVDPSPVTGILGTPTVVTTEVVIDHEQRKFLFEIMNRANMSEATFLNLLGTLGYESTKEIPVDKYNDVLTALDDAIKANKQEQGETIPVLE